MNELGDFVWLSFVKATPIAFAAIAGVACERSGILNIALEGALAAGAFTAVAVSSATGNPLVGAAAGILAGALVCGTLGVAATRFGIDQIVAGTGLNVLAIGAAAFGIVVLFATPGATPEVRALGSRGAALLVGVAALAAVGVHAVLFATPWGLHVRACGENPKAAVSAGLDPRRIRTIATIAGGCLAGLGGVFLSLGELDLYSDGMTAGRGFIALAAVIFGRWTPLGAYAAALAFGALSALQFVLQRRGVPTELLQALPYVVALVALTGAFGRSRAPAADGVPLEE